MRKYIITYCLTVCFITSFSAISLCNLKINNPIEKSDSVHSWIRINQLGYLPAGIKVAVFASKQVEKTILFELIEAGNERVVFRTGAGKAFGAYGPFKSIYRLNFSKFKKSGNYYLRCGNIKSPVFRIADDVYKGAADFALNYMRQQRSGFNPYLKDSCHTTDGYTMYGPMPDTTRIDVSGGWHDASDYLQYAPTSANATYHLLAAYRDYPEVFTDKFQANGLAGSNGKMDVLDEAKWGLDWLMKMHPRPDWLFNQLADDRDHQGMRLPSEDLINYGVGKGKGRPVYFATGKPQGLGKYKNRSEGVASTAGKFASAFALAAQEYRGIDNALADIFKQKALSAYKLGLEKPGVCQTAPNLAPYFYEEDNWVDDMHLAAASLYQLTGEKKYFFQSLQYGLEETVTPWMGQDTAKHYQWYPFHNFGHFELAQKSDTKTRSKLIGFYKDGIERVWKKAKGNGFLRGIPFIWCSNNLTTSFAIQCVLYKQLSGDKTFEEFEQANFDWLFGCNPWGISMVYGLPAGGNTPKDPHSAFTHLHHFPIDGGLIDGPVYGSIFKGLKGITLYNQDQYAQFQSDLVVYHDDYGDYSSNEPTMDGTASLVYLLAAEEHKATPNRETTDSQGAIIRGDITKKKIALVSKSQSIKFGFVTDTHIGSGTSAEDLRRTVQDINADTSLRFVVITGDITEFGSDNELQLAKQILDSLNKKWYSIPGNHDANWSESGGNSFRKVFGSETFSFVYGGYLFAATNSGPNMRMSPGQVPRENLVWLEDILKNMQQPDMPVIYLNHYPQDSSLNNWYEPLDLLKKRNIQLILLGHGHANHSYNFEGIQGVMGRSNLRAKDSIGGYNIVTIQNGIATFEERKPLVKTQKKWLEAQLFNHHFDKDTTHYFRPSYAINKQYPTVKKIWEYQDQSDIGSGTALSKNLVISTNTNGDIYALNINNGKRKWLFHTNGKIYSTPVATEKYVIAGSTDNNIYCLSQKTGKLIWKVTTLKPVLASPIIHNSVVYIGGSDGHFRALQIETGKVVWDFDQVKGFVVTKPLIYHDKIYFGCWNNDFYALNQTDGSLAWKWNNNSNNRMLSPAACLPVATHGRIFIVAPDRYMTSLDTDKGNVIWRKQMPDVRVRESMGLSSDSTLVYVKTMDGQLFGISTTADSMLVSWKSKLQLPYELAPTAIVEHDGIVYVPSHSGVASAIDRQTGKVLWKHKTSNCLVSSITPIKNNLVVVSTMDGKITCLKYTPNE